MTAQRPGHNTKDAPLLDPTALARFGKLEVVARLVVEGFMMGQHKSPFKGASVEFIEHRQYYPGDEIRHIDWRAFGKTGKYYIKEFEDETNLRCYLIVDSSGSMSFADSTLSKADYARCLAASLGYLLVSQRDAVGLIQYDTEIRGRCEPSTSPRTFQQITGLLENATPGGETSMAKVFEEIQPTLKRRSLVVIISDCFDNYDDLISAISRFRHARHEVILFRVVAPEEEDFPFSRPTQFRSLEREGHRILVDPHRLREGYLEQYREFSEGLAKACGTLGVDYRKFVTTEPYQSALGSFLDIRTRARKQR